MAHLKILQNTNFYELKFLKVKKAITFIIFKYTNKMSLDKSFFSKVYDVVRAIPHGRITTYGLIANYLGSTNSARVVGYAMNSSHKLIDVPAHRVVNRIGLLTGKHHFAGTNLMKELLESEGVRIKNDIVIDFDKLLWNPSKELK